MEYSTAMTVVLCTVKSAFGAETKSCVPLAQEESSVPAAHNVTKHCDSSEGITDHSTPYKAAQQLFSSPL
eukprot:14273536-Ditylum_brightwellii.AAC.1